MFARLRRLFKSMPKELPWRANVMLAAVAAAVWVVMFRYLEMGEPWSLRSLAIVAGAVVGIACLLYATRISLWTVAGAACVYFLREANKLQYSQVLVPLIVIGFILVLWHTNQAICHVGAVLGQRLDELHDKVDALQEKLEEIEAEQDELA